MKKKRLPTPTEVLMPEEVALKKNLKKQYLKRDCPDCGGDTFRILEVVRKPQNGGAGHYRCQCTVCDFIEVVVSKNPYHQEGREPKKGKTPRRRGLEDE